MLILFVLKTSVMPPDSVKEFVRINNARSSGLVNLR